MSDVSTPPGQQTHDFGKELRPICRSITGDGVRQAGRIKDLLPGLEIHALGDNVFRLDRSDEWNIREAFIGPDGERVVDFRDNNLHVVGYSEPVT